MVRIIKYLLFLTALTPMIVSWSTPFSFVLGKIVFFRILIEAALIFFALYLFSNRGTFKPLNSETPKHPPVGGATGQAFNLKLKNLIKNPVFIALSLFLISFAISVIFAENSYRAFWGDLERGEGLFGMLHFFAFLIMAVSVFEKKDWLNYFKISLAVGLIIIFYAFLQYFGVKDFPFALIPEARPISFIGNAAFLATHMFFLMMFSVIVFFETLKQTLKLLNFETFKLLWWRYFSLLIIILSVATIFITATRGAILGLAAGIFALLIYFAFKPLNSETLKLKFLNQRFVSIILLSLIVIFSAAFWFTRDAEIWQKIPGLNRLAKTAIFNINDYSTQFRLMTWRLSLEAAKEKPLLGWGPENYLMAYEKHYNPDYAVYGESWLDRAHNKIFDVLVMQGIFGLLAYLGIFGAALYLLIKKPLINADEKPIHSAQPFLMAGIIAYFVQNLVLFDTIVSYYVLFAVLGYLISSGRNQSQEVRPPEINSRYLGSRTSQILSRFAFYFIAAILIICLGYSLYFYNYIPYVQAKAINEMKKISQASLIEKKLKEEIVEPYNFAQFNLRAYIVDHYYNDQPQIFNNASFNLLSDFFVNLIEEIIQKEPYDIRMFIRKTQMLQSKAINDVNLYKKAEESIRQAIELSPNRQELYYNLSFNLLGQERFQEAVDAVEKSVELSPNVARGHYHFAFVLAVIGLENEKEIIREMEIADKLSPNFKGLQPGDQNIIALIYSRLGYSDKVAELVKRSIDMQLSIRFLPIYYEEALGYFALLRDADNFIKLAKDMLKFYPNLKDDMEVLIDLAEKENWEIIDSLAR